MKNSVEKVAEAFAMSEVSIYKYIQQVKNEWFKLLQVS